MHIISAIGRSLETAVIREASSELFPGATFISEDSLQIVSELIRSLQPELVWLQASPESIELAAKGRETSPDTNFIFISDDKDLAYDAIRMRASGYIPEPLTEEDLKEEMLHLRYPVKDSDAGIYIRCLGGFDVYYDGKPLHFSRARSKEALAYLVHRRGFMCSMSELCSILWPKRTIDVKLKSQCRMIMSSLRKDLETIGAGEILIKEWNGWGLDTGKVTCDYYEMIAGVDHESGTVKGSYMPQYPWAGEPTLIAPHQSP